MNLTLMSFSLPAALRVAIAGSALCAAAPGALWSSVERVSVEACAEAAPGRPPRLKRLRWDHERLRRAPPRA